MKNFFDLFFLIEKISEFPKLSLKTINVVCVVWALFLKKQFWKIPHKTESSFVESAKRNLKCTEVLQFAVPAAIRKPSDTCCLNQSMFRN